MRYDIDDVCMGMGMGMGIVALGGVNSWRYPIESIIVTIVDVWISYAIQSFKIPLPTQNAIADFRNPSHSTALNVLVTSLASAQKLPSERP